MAPAGEEEARDGREFPLAPGLTFLQTGSCGLMPRSVRERDRRRQDRFLREGPHSGRVSRWLAVETREARRTLAGLLGATADDVAWIENVTTGFDCLALGLEWHEGDEVVALASEHPAGLMPFRRLEERRGVRLRLVPVPERGAPDAGAIEAALGPRTRLLVMSHISYTTGAAAPVAQVASAARARGVLTAVDGAQAAGLMPVDVASLDCDAYIAPGYKWCLGPEGTAAIYMRRELAAALYPHRVGYFGVRELAADGRYRLLADARKVQGTTYNQLGFLAWADAVRYLEDRGREAILLHVRELVASAAAAIAARPYLEPAGQSDAGLVTFRMPGHETDEVVARLEEGYGIILRAVPFPPALRISLHLYNGRGDLERLFAALDELAAG